MHHTDRSVHSAGFTMTGTQRAQARTFNAWRYLRAFAILAAVLIALRMVSP